LNSSKSYELLIESVTHKSPTVQVNNRHHLSDKLSALSGFIWLYLALSGFIWLYLALSGFIWLYLALSGFIVLV